MRKLRGVKRVVHALLGAALAAGLADAPALGQTVQAPPGNSGIDQYVEVVPNPGGGARLNSKRRPLPASARRALQREGDAGRKALDLAERYADPAAPQTRSGRAPAISEPASPAEEGRGDAALGVLTGANAAGMGFLLPMLLALTTAAIVVTGVRRHTGRNS